MLETHNKVFNMIKRTKKILLALILFFLFLNMSPLAAIATSGGADYGPTPTTTGTSGGLDYGPSTTTPTTTGTSGGLDYGPSTTTTGTSTTSGTSTGTGLVQCGNEGQAACTFNDLFTTLGNVVNFVISNIVPPLAILGVVWAAVIMMTSGGDPAKFNQGKSALMAIAIGLVIIYLSWWIVKSFVQFLGGQDWTLQFFDLNGK